MALQQPMLEWLANNYKKFGCLLEFVTGAMAVGTAWRLRQRRHVVHCVGCPAASAQHVAFLHAPPPPPPPLLFLHACLFADPLHTPCPLPPPADRSEEGNQFCKGFGGIGGVLRYSVRTSEGATPIAAACWCGGWEVGGGRAAGGGACVL